MASQHVKNWFSSNWLWLVPVGGCLTVILLFIFRIGAAIFGVSKAIKNAEPYEYAIKIASNNPELINLIGEPIETDGMMKGSIHYNNGKSFVDISIPLRGPQGKATVSIKGEKSDDVWDYEAFYITIKETREQINLLDKILQRI